MVYAWLLVFTLTGPLLYSFDRRTAYYKKWWALFPAIALVATVFLVWDHIFTLNGVWGFNSRYLLGITLGVMPVEEYLFFVIVPYACVFIHECMKYYIPKDIFGDSARPFTWVLCVVLVILAIASYGRDYTFVTSAATSVFLLIHLLVLRAKYLGRFWVGYAISLIPFFLVNGLLTGTGLEEPVVWYNNDENLGVRLGTIPIEDSIYLVLLLGGVVTIYEELLRSRDRLRLGDTTQSVVSHQKQ